MIGKYFHTLSTLTGIVLGALICQQNSWANFDTNLFEGCPLRSEKVIQEHKSGKTEVCVTSKGEVLRSLELEWTDVKDGVQQYRVRRLTEVASIHGPAYEYYQKFKKEDSDLPSENHAGLIITVVFDTSQNEFTYVRTDKGRIGFRNEETWNTPLEPRSISWINAKGTETLRTLYGTRTDAKGRTYEVKKNFFPSGLIYEEAISKNMKRFRRRTVVQRLTKEVRCEDRDTGNYIESIWVAHDDDGNLTTSSYKINQKSGEDATPRRVRTLSNTKEAWSLPEMQVLEKCRHAVDSTPPLESTELQRTIADLGMPEKSAISAAEIKKTGPIVIRRESKIQSGRFKVKF